MTEAFTTEAPEEEVRQAAAGGGLIFDDDQHASWGHLCGGLALDPRPEASLLLLPSIWSSISA